MKITKADLISLITEVLEENADKFQKALDTLRNKRNVLKIQIAKKDIEIAQELLNQALDREQTASDALDAAENRGEDTSNETDSLNSAKDNTQKARKSLDAAKNALKSAQAGGIPN